LKNNRPPYNLNPPKQGECWKEWRKKAQEAQGKLEREINQKQEQKNTRRVQKLVDRMQSSERTSPSAFFQKVKKPNSRGGLVRVMKRDGTRVGEAIEVKNEVKEVWEDVWASKPLKENTGEQPWFSTRFMEKIYNEVSRNDKTNEPFTIEEIKRILNSKARNKAPGIDGAVNEIFYYARDEIADYVLKIFNEFLKPDAEIPEEWMVSRIFLIYKDSPNGSEENPLEYRPISLMCVGYKMFTTLIEQRLRKVHENLFSNTQGGFRPNRACIHKVTTLVNTILDAKLNEREIHILFLDIKKAYDSVHIDEVLFTLNRMGYNLDIINLLAKLNTNCQGTIMTPYGDTDRFTFGGGLRQGDPISPLLFLLFLEPLLGWIEEEHTGYKLTRFHSNNKQ